MVVNREESYLDDAVPICPYSEEEALREPEIGFHLEFPELLFLGIVEG